MRGSIAFLRVLVECLSNLSNSSPGVVECSRVGVRMFPGIFEAECRVLVMGGWCCCPSVYRDTQRSGIGTGCRFWAARSETRASVSSWRTEVVRRTAAFCLGTRRSVFSTTSRWVMRRSRVQAGRYCALKDLLGHGHGHRHAFAVSGHGLTVTGACSRGCCVLFDATTWLLDVSVW